MIKSKKQIAKEEAEMAAYLKVATPIQEVRDKAIAEAWHKFHVTREEIWSKYNKEYDEAIAKLPEIIAVSGKQRQVLSL